MRFLMAISSANFFTLMIRVLIILLIGIFIIPHFFGNNFKKIEITLFIVMLIIAIEIIMMKISFFLSQKEYALDNSVKKNQLSIGFNFSLKKIINKFIGKAQLYFFLINNQNEVEEFLDSKSMIKTTTNFDSNIDMLFYKNKQTIFYLTKREEFYKTLVDNKINFSQAYLIKLLQRNRNIQLISYYKIIDLIVDYNGERIIPKQLAYIIERLKNKRAVTISLILELDEVNALEEFYLFCQITKFEKLNFQYTVVDDLESSNKRLKDSLEEFILDIKIHLFRADNSKINHIAVLSFLNYLRALEKYVKMINESIVSICSGGNKGIDIIFHFIRNEKGRSADKIDALKYNLVS